MIRVLIVDDHPIVRDGLRLLIEKIPDMTAVDEATSGEDALEKIEAGQVDVVVLDITLPGMSGIDVLKQIKHNGWKLPVLVLSVHTEGPYIKRAFEAGAAGYLSKDSAREELVTAIREISVGQRYLSSSIAQQLAISMDGDIDGQPKQLTPREFEIMRMLSSGKTVSEVSRQLFLSVKTVSTHRTRILQKLNLKTNIELAYYAMKNKLLDE